MSTKGSIPQMNTGAMTRGQGRLFYSKRDIALIREGVYQAGFGYLPPGQIMAKNAVTGKLVPYVPDTVVFGTTKGVARAIADVANGAAIVYVTQEDSYKFAIGDSLILAQDATFLDGGAITAIDRDTDNWRAKITFTNATAVATYTMANNTHCYPKAGTAGKFSKAFCICDMGVDTGYGADDDAGTIPQGGLGSFVLKNATLYKMSLVDFDDQALADLASVTVPVVENNFLNI